MLNIEEQLAYITTRIETEDGARKALLQITSAYGKITKTGVKQFCVSIPDYKAPSIAKFVSKPVKAKEAKPQAAEPDPKRPVVVRALVQFRIFILSLILIHGSIATVKSRNELFCKIGWKDVFASSVALHYKVATMFYLCKLWPAIGLLALAIRHMKKIRPI